LRIIKYYYIEINFYWKPDIAQKVSILRKDICHTKLTINFYLNINNFYITLFSVNYSTEVIPVIQIFII